jgi:hypothetical protein
MIYINVSNDRCFLELIFKNAMLFAVGFADYLHNELLAIFLVQIFPHLYDFWSKIYQSYNVWIFIEIKSPYDFASDSIFAILKVKDLNM